MPDSLRPKVHCKRARPPGVDAPDLEISPVRLLQDRYVQLLISDQLLQPRVLLLELLEPLGLLDIQTSVLLAPAIVRVLAHIELDGMSLLRSDPLREEPRLRAAL
jgi:hypothetical protein